MRTLTVRLLTTSAAIALSLQASAQPKPEEIKAGCEALAGKLTVAKDKIGLPSGNVRFVSSAFASKTELSLSERAPTPAAKINPATPDFCKLLGEIGPVDPSAPPIKFQINLPWNWNGKFLQYGGGGFNGVLITGLGLLPAAPYDKPAPLAQGYATVGTDSGHETKPGEAPQLFAANDEAFVNFAHAAYKKVHDVAVAVSEQTYGRKPGRYYFAGSSEGGREALTMAQRYPQDFDGVFARVPVINWAGLQHAGFRSGMVTMGDAWLSPAHVKLVHAATLAACDASDGVADGVVANPTACLRFFKVGDLKCKDGQTPDTCLNDGQIKAVETLRSVYKFPFPVANGLDDYPGWGIGGEGQPAAGPTGGWGAWWTGTAAPTWPLSQGNGIAWVYGAGGIAHVFAKNPALDVMKYNVEEHKARILEVSNLMDSTNPDLSAFHARGGRVIMLEHLADYAQSPYAGIRYYENVVKTMGAERAGQTIRLFTAPGVDHVGTGGPALVDMLGALDAWVEQGKPPAKLTLVEQEAVAPFQVKRAMPLCEWPAWPKHKGGDASKAENFECTQ